MANIKDKHSGFTLIELIIVLAISSLLTLILIGQQTERTKRARFTNSMEQLVSRIERVKTEANGTVNLRNSGGTPDGGNDESTIVAGKGVVFSSGSDVMDIYTFTADNNQENFQGVTIDGGSNETYGLDYGSTFRADLSTGVSAVFLRSPANGALKSYVFSVGDLGQLTDSARYRNHSGGNGSDLTADKLNYVFESLDGYLATISIDRYGNIALEYN